MLSPSDSKVRHLQHAGLGFLGLGVIGFSNFPKEINRLVNLCNFVRDIIFYLC